jgi:protein Tex
MNASPGKPFQPELGPFPCLALPARGTGPRFFDAHTMPLPLEHRLATEMAVRPEQIRATLQLLDEGATVPFIARYRKEATGGLDDTQLRFLDERLAYLRELDSRRLSILSSLEEQGVLTPELAKSVDEAQTKQTLEDLYLPYKPKRRTKAQMAREAGLAPLAQGLLENPEQDPIGAAQAFLNPDAGFADTKAVLEGARQILMERFAEEATLLGALRTYLQDHGVVVSRVIPGKENEGSKFRDWFDFREALSTLPSHRALALFRGRNEGLLRVHLALDDDPLEENAHRTTPHPCEARIARHFGVRQAGRPADAWLGQNVRFAWQLKIALHLELELMNALRERAEEQAIEVFSHNLKDLLLAAPAGARTTLGLDPGVRTGVKAAVVDATGKVLDTATVYPFEPRRDVQGALACLARLCETHRVELIAIGNGTHSRETDRLVGELLKRPGLGTVTKVVVSEAGASVYSASELAAQEFPDLDVSLRGAVSIARRLQDPLAELVKIDPKSIGVGQYQHDVSQVRLAKSLDAVIEDCVNAVGVDVNMASIPLLSRISGLNTRLAQQIVMHRDANGPFLDRQALKKVPRLGPKTFEQAAGFLRISGGKNPLDASGVHPEAYPLVERILTDLGREVNAVMGHTGLLSSVNPIRYTDDRFGLPTVQDILKELDKPGRDPRPEFAAARFAEGVESLSDLVPGMQLEGVVTNVTHFGAFVDIGVHQDGLVHISALSERFIKDPRDVVKAGDIVRVKVLEVDALRKRIALTLRLKDPLPTPGESPSRAPHTDRTPRASAMKPGKTLPAADNTLAHAFKAAINAKGKAAR